VTVVALVVSLITAAPASADDVAGHVASARSESLPVVEDADRAATASAVAQATARRIFHADISGLLGTCASAGEIVGMGPNLGAVFQAFHQSVPHRDILMNPAWTGIGTGHATGADGKVYVSVVFCRVAGSVDVLMEAPTANLAPSPPTTGPGTKPTDVPAAVRRIDIREWLDPQAASMLATRYVESCRGDGQVAPATRDHSTCLRAT